MSTPPERSGSSITTRLAKAGLVAPALGVVVFFVAYFIFLLGGARDYNIAYLLGVVGTLVAQVLVMGGVITLIVALVGKALLGLANRRRKP